MISVVISFKNPGPLILRAIDSALSQFSQGDEVVAVDDGSTDSSWVLANEKYRGLANVKLIKSTGKGISAARNLGNKSASNKFIYVLDADDYLCEGAIGFVKGEIAAYPDVDVLYGDIKLKIKDKVMRYPRYPEYKSRRCAKRRVMAFPIVPFKHSAVIYRKDCIETLGGYDEELTSKIDIDLALRFIFYTNKIRKINQYLAVHEKHKCQVSSKRIQGMGNYKKVFWKLEKNPIKRVAYLAIRFFSEMLKHLVFIFRLA
jgi:glycosyltransferase involved in cell wall biosynthesis